MANKTKKISPDLNRYSRITILLVIAIIVRFAWFSFISSEGFDPVTLEKPDSVFFLQLAEYIKASFQGQGGIEAAVIPEGSLYENRQLFKRISILLPLLASPLTFIFNGSLATLSVSFIAGVLLIIPLYLLTEKIAGSQYAVTASLIACFHPKLIYHSTTGCGETLYFLFGCSAILTFFQLVKNEAPFTNSFLTGFLWGIASLARPEGAALIFWSALLVIILVKGHLKFKLTLASIVLAGGLLIVIPQKLISNSIQGGLRRPPMAVTINEKTYSPLAMQYSLEMSGDSGDSKITNQWAFFLFERMGFDRYFDLLLKTYNKYDPISLGEILKISSRNLLYHIFIEPNFVIVLLFLYGVFLSANKNNKLPFITILIGFLAILPIPFIIKSFHLYFHIFIVTVIPAAAIGICFFKSKKASIPLILILCFAFCFGISERYQRAREGSIPSEKILKHWFQNIDAGNFMLSFNPWLARAAKAKWVPPPPDGNTEEVVKILDELGVTSIAIDTLYMNDFPVLSPQWAMKPEFLNYYKLEGEFNLEDYELRVYSRKPLLQP